MVIMQNLPSRCRHNCKCAKKTLINSIYLYTILAMAFIYLRPSDLPERTFSNYILKECLGSGSFGVVWKAMKKDSDQNYYALKMSLIEKGDEERQRREFEIALQLKHKNLVKAHEWNKQEITAAELDNHIPAASNCHKLIAAARERRNVEIYWMRMELGGENLRSWLQKKHDRFNKEVQNMQHKIVKGMVNGLKCIHSKRILHRDLKPENILFWKEGFQLPVKIGDYGNSRIRSEAQASALTSGVGTDLYKSPEVWSKDYDFKSDIFSLGLIIWEVIQFIPFTELKSHFDRLVYDKQEELVKPLAKTVDFVFSPLVKRMCLRDVKQRMEGLECVFGRLNFQFFAKDSAEFTEILDVCEDGWTIKLGEGTFEGPFYITVNNLTLSGRGIGTMLTTCSTSARCALALTGNGIQCSHFSINACYDGIGAFVSGNQCAFEKISVENCAIGFLFGRKFENVAGMDGFREFIRNVNSRAGVSIDHPSLFKMSIETTMIGILLCNVNKATLSDIKIINPGKCGVMFSKVGSKVKLSDVYVDVTPDNSERSLASMLQRLAKEIEPFTFSENIKRPNALYGIYIAGINSGEFDFRNVRCKGFNKREGFAAGLLVEDETTSLKLSKIEKIVFGDNFPL